MTNPIYSPNGFIVISVFMSLMIISSLIPIVHQSITTFQQIIQSRHYQTQAELLIQTLPHVYPKISHHIPNLPTPINRSNPFTLTSGHILSTPAGTIQLGRHKEWIITDIHHSNYHQQSALKLDSTGQKIIAIIPLSDL